MKLPGNGQPPARSSSYFTMVSNPAALGRKQPDVPGMSRQAAAALDERVFLVSPEGDLDMLTRPVALLTRGGR